MEGGSAPEIESMLVSMILLATVMRSSKKVAHAWLDGCLRSWRATSTVSWNLSFWPDMLGVGTLTDAAGLDLTKSITPGINPVSVKSITQNEDAN